MSHPSAARRSPPAASSLCGVPHVVLLLVVVIAVWHTAAVRATPEDLLKLREKHSYAYVMWTKKQKAGLEPFFTVPEMNALDHSTAPSIYTAAMQDAVVKTLQSYTLSAVDIASASGAPIGRDTLDPTNTDSIRNALQAPLNVGVAQCKKIHPLCCTLYWMTGNSTDGMPESNVSSAAVFWQNLAPANGFFSNFSTALVEGLLCASAENSSGSTWMLSIDVTGQWLWYKTLWGYYRLREIDINNDDVTNTTLRSLAREMERRVAPKDGDQGTGIGVIVPLYAPIVACVVLVGALVGLLLILFLVTGHREREDSIHRLSVRYQDHPSLADRSAALESGSRAPSRQGSMREKVPASLPPVSRNPSNQRTLSSPQRTSGTGQLGRCQSHTGLPQRSPSCPSTPNQPERQAQRGLSTLTPQREKQENGLLHTHSAPLLGPGTIQRKGSMRHRIMSEQMQQQQGQRTLSGGLLRRQGSSLVKRQAPQPAPPVMPVYQQQQQQQQPQFYMQQQQQQQQGQRTLSGGSLRRQGSSLVKRQAPQPAPPVMPVYQQQQQQQQPQFYMQQQQQQQQQLFVLQPTLSSGSLRRNGSESSLQRQGSQRLGSRKVSFVNLPHEDSLKQSPPNLLSHPPQRAPSAQGASDGVPSVYHYANPLVQWRNGAL